MSKAQTGLDSPDPDIYVRALYPNDTFLPDYKCPAGHDPRAKLASIKRKKLRKDRPIPRTTHKILAKIAVNWVTLSGLLEIQCVAQEIESVLRINIDTLDQRCQVIYGQTWGEWSAQFKAEGKISLRRVMHQKAIVDKDTVMLKHLSTHYLGMGTEQGEQADGTSKKIVITFQDLKQQGAHIGKPRTT